MMLLFAIFLGLIAQFNAVEGAFPSLQDRDHVFMSMSRYILLIFCVSSQIDFCCQLEKLKYC